MNPDKEKKMRGGSESELTRFKIMWRDSMSESAREFWRELFISKTTQPEIRKQIFAKLKIKLDWDSQLNSFRDWEEDQRARALREERALENQRRIIAEHPDWTLEQVREEVLRQSYFEALATGDHKTGLKTAAVHTKVETVHLDRDKFKETLRDKLQAGLDEVAAAFKKNPQAMEFYKQARALISRETK